MRKLSKILLAVIFVTALHSQSIATDDWNDRSRILRGIKDLSVYIGINVKDRNISVLSRNIRTDTEIELRRSGIKITNNESFYKLISVITALDDEISGSIMYSVIMYLELPVVRITDVQLFNPTTHNLDSMVLIDSIINITHIVKGWDDGVYGATPSNKFDETTRKTVKDLTNKFINDYLAVNETPKKSARERLKELGLDENGDSLKNDEKTNR